ncbi:MAG: hypothetical protein AAF394_05025 [Planctomycetota bacterium]
MLTTSEEVLLEHDTETESQARPNRAAESLKNESEPQVSESEIKTSPIKRMLRLEWLGQAVASICWIVSVFSYGIEKTGDWLQLAAASAWLLANIATIIFPNSD